MNLKRLLLPALISVAFDMPVGGFVFGFIHIQGSAWWNVLARGIVGMVFAVLTSITLGFPPRNEGGVGEPYNVWPYIIATGIALFLITTVVCLSWRTSKKD